MKCLRCYATEEWIDHVPSKQITEETKRLRAEVRKLRSALRDICAMTYDDNVSAADIEVVAEKALRRKRGGA